MHGRDRLVWMYILAVSLLEPIFQMQAGHTAGSVTWLEAYVGLHVFAFNLLQLHVFRLHGFVAMFAFRLVYYLWWHILWGYLRIGLLF
jgi:riboflavin transporter FmnP